MIPLSNFKNFSEAGQAVLKFLSQAIPFQLWMITRTEGNDWIVLQTENAGYQICSGDVFNWADSYCFRMLEQGAPKIAPSAHKIDLYKNASINQIFDIQAYIGQPIVQKDGSLFGTLCAIDPKPQSEDINQLADLVELLGKLLSNILQAELSEQEQIRQAERLEVDASTDHLTGLFNRRAWDKLVALEDARCKQYGHISTALVIDLNDLKIVNDQQGHSAGDALIRQAALILQNSIRTQDILARLGGDEFGIILVEANHEYCDTCVEHISTCLKEANISASIGASVKHISQNLYQALKEADIQMYANKKIFKQKRFHRKNHYYFIK